MYEYDFINYCTENHLSTNTYNLITLTVGWKFSPGRGCPTFGGIAPPAGEAYGAGGIGLAILYELLVYTIGIQN